jgi:hypothetical protein
LESLRLSNKRYANNAPPPMRRKVVARCCAPALNADGRAFGGQSAELLDEVMAGATANLTQSLTQLAGDGDSAGGGEGLSNISRFEMLDCMLVNRGRIRP